MCAHAHTRTRARAHTHTQPTNGVTEINITIGKGKNALHLLFVLDEKSLDEVLGIIRHTVPDIVIKVVVCVVHQRECLALVFTRKGGVTTQPATIQKGCLL